LFVDGRYLRGRCRILDRFFDVVRGVYRLCLSPKVHTNLTHSQGGFMKTSKIAQAMGVSMKRLRHLGFSLKRIVVKKVGSHSRRCEVRILKQERQV